MDDREAWAERLFVGSRGHLEQPRRICDLCVSALDVTGAYIMMAQKHAITGTAYTTSRHASYPLDLQLTVGQGPDLDALGTRSPILVDDLDHPDDLAVERWTAFLDGMTTSSIRAIFSFPLRIGSNGIGTLTLTRDVAGAMTRPQLSAALMAADAAALAVLYLAREPGDDFSHLTDGPFSYYPQIHQATGMVQVQLGSGPETAFLMLRARAFATGQSLLDTAIEVLQRRYRFSMEDQ
jgi:hypothetical protein